MKGFDEQAALNMLEQMKNDELEINADAMQKVIAFALEGELEYMRSVGILTNKGEFKDGEYDDDDAFDFITDYISKSMPDCDPYTVTDYLEYYFDYHDQYLTENGILEWF